MSEQDEQPDIVLVERRLAGENGRFNIYLDHVRAHDGYSVPDYLVVAPKHHGARLGSGVGVLPCLEGRFGLVRLFRHPVGEVVWEIPGGFLEPSEPPEVSARRELEEETGLTCPEGRLVPLGTILPEAGILRARIHLYAALDCVQIRPFPREEIGHREFRWFSLDEINELLRENGIEDATTIAALHKLTLLGHVKAAK